MTDVLNNDYAYFEEQIDKLTNECVSLGNEILQNHQQVDKIECILKDTTISYENRVEIVLELIEQIK